ncbi:TPA: transporter substrate-binding domain-containing protein [Serratia fonticola]|uniref:transporter substrate-binding domain-containing protein n=1 Tax=Serratia fonticola TaxID=47917 RepID=UPI00217C8984|nr:transporter substrate-binding domain-containing protein [Serratia fonticola]CAI1724131.1 Virulence sensor protein BvgS precursor [Serratia fonticola]
MTSNGPFSIPSKGLSGYLLLFFFLFITILTTPTVHATHLSPEEKNWLAAHPILLVGTYANGLPPLEEVAKNQLTGLAPEILSKIATRLNFTVKIKEYPTRLDLMQGLKQGEVDVIMNTSPTFIEAKLLCYSLAYGDNDLIIISSRDNLRILDHTDLAKASVAAVAGSPEAILILESYPAAKLRLYPDQTTALLSVERGDNDAFIGNRYAIRYYIALNKSEAFRYVGNAHLPLQTLRFAFPQRHHLLAGAFDKIMTEIGPREQQAIFEKWVSPYPSPRQKSDRINLSPNQIMYLNQLPSLRTSNLESYPPFSFRNQVGEPSGLVEDYFELVQRQLQLKIERIRIGSLNELLERVKKGEIDIIPGLPATEERMRYLVFSQPYARFPLVIATRKETTNIEGLESLGKARVAFSEGTEPIPTLLRNKPELTLLRIDTAEEGLKLLANHQVDAYIGNLVVTDRIITDQYPNLLKVAAPTGYYAELTIAVSKKYANLIPLINRTLANISPARKELIRSTWFPITFSDNTSILLIISQILPAILVMFIILAILIIAHWRLRKEINQKIRIQQMLTDITESLPVTVFQCCLSPDGNLRFTYVAGAPVATFGLSAESMQADHDSFYNLLNTEDIPAVQQAFSRMQDSLTPFQAEFRMRVKGDMCWIRGTTGTGKRHSNGDVLWGGYFEDITQSRHQKQLLYQAKAKAEAAAEAKAIFLATMSHELRTPVHGMLGWLELLGRTQLNTEQSRMLATVQGSAQHLTQVIDDILDFSKLEAGQVLLENIEIDLRERLSDLMQTISLQALAKGLTLHLHISHRVAHKLKCDPLRLDQILMNFLSNSLKFTHTGHIALRVSVLRDEKTCQQLQLSISDTGIGIPLDTQQQLFQPFQQAEASTTRRFGGTGLGLAISKGLAEQMNGQLTLFSEPDKGTTLSLDVGFEVPTSPAGTLEFQGKNAAIWCNEANLADDLQEMLLALGFMITRVSGMQTLVQTLHNCDLLFVEQSLLANQHIDNIDKVKVIILRNTIQPDRQPEKTLAVNPLSWRRMTTLCRTLLSAQNTEEPHSEVPTNTTTMDAGLKRQHALENGTLILVAEDHPISRDLIMHQLQILGYCFDMVNDGQQALQAIENTNYGLAIIDYHMPYIDGLELSIRIREKERIEDRERLKIVALTAGAMEGQKEQCIAAGMDAYLTKPINIKGLKTIIEHLLTL